MRAVVITRPGDVDVLAIQDVPDPSPGPRQIRVRVHATALNRADLLQRAGVYPAPPGWPRDIPGLEYAGVVDALGDGVTRWRTGDRVMGLVGGGSCAEYVVTHEDEALAVPASLSLEEAAAVPEAFITAHDALFTRMQLERGESLLIHAVGSGVGTAALQLAKARDAFVIGTQRTLWKLERAQELGLDVALQANATNFAARVLDIPRTSAGVDGVLDLVGGDYLDGNLRAIRVLGRIVVVGLVAGARAELDMRLLLNRRVTMIGTVLRARTPEQKIEATRAFERDVLPLLSNGTVKPIIGKTLRLEQVAHAHELVERNEVFGKIVLGV